MDDAGYLRQVEAVHATARGALTRVLFLSTEDSATVEYFQAQKNWTVLVTDVERYHEKVSPMEFAAQRDLATMVLNDFVSLELALQCDAWVGLMSSNGCGGRQGEGAAVIGSQVWRADFWWRQRVPYRGVGLRGAAFLQVGECGVGGRGAGKRRTRRCRKCVGKQTGRHAATRPACVGSVAPNQCHRGAEWGSGSERGCARP